MAHFLVEWEKSGSPSCTYYFYVTSAYLRVAGPELLCSLDRQPAPWLGWRADKGPP